MSHVKHFQNANHHLPVTNACVFFSFRKWPCHIYSPYHVIKTQVAMSNLRNVDVAVSDLVVYTPHGGPPGSALLVQWWVADGVGARGAPEPENRLEFTEHIYMA